MTFLKINNLSVDYQMRKETVYAAKNVNIEVNKGEILGLVGESGSGKSTVGNAIINLIDEPGKVSSGSVILGDLNIHENSESIVKYRGNKIGLIFQDPQTSLNPILTVGEQLIETIQTHLKLSKEEAKNKSINLLKEVGIKDAETRFDNYPHQFSGGMRQRVVISLALCCEPELLIADEPTTALDVSIQSQILELIKKLTKERNLAVILITHDMGVIAETADRVAVMKSGNLVEIGETKKILTKPQENYTKSLVSSVPPTNKKISRFVIVEKENSFKLCWEKAENGTPPTGYMIEGRIGNDWVDIVTVIGRETWASIRKSEADGVNAWRVSGGNENGRGRASEEIFTS